MSRTSWHDIERQLVLQPNGCREWIGEIGDKGYGVIGYEGKKQKIHRLVWMRYKGRIPRGKKVCHTCDNPPCGEITHLFLGTQKQNMEDAARKGRMATGSRHGSKKHPESYLRKATEKQVYQIRAMKRKLEITNTDIANLLGLTYDTVKQIASGKTHRYLL